MHRLPTMHPLYQQISASRVRIPEMLEKLAGGGFTGYVHHACPDFEVYCLFAFGKLICAASSDGSTDRTGLEALALMFEKAVRSGGELGVYRMTADLAMCSHALLAGTRLFMGDEVRQVDMKGVLGRLKSQGANGVVLFTASPRYGMIFYKSGQPIGFCHDGATSVIHSPDESRSVAAIPGATLHVCTTRPIEELVLYDLLQLVNLDKLWASAEARNSAAVRQPEPLSAARQDNGTPDGILTELADDLRELASAYLSKEGGAMLERLLAAAGGRRVLTDPRAVAKLLDVVRHEAGLIDSHARIDEMIDLMKSEIAGRLAV